MGSRTAVRVRKRSSSRGTREELGEEIVGHETVVSPELGRARHARSARVGRERREVETRGPTLRVLRELGDLVVRQVQAGCAKQLVRLGLVHTQLVWPDLQRQAARPQRPQRQSGLPLAESTSCEPAAACLASAAMASKHGWLSSRWRSSKTRTTASSIVARAFPRRGTTVPSIEAPGDVSASNTLESSRETRSRAVATYVSRTIGSLSFASTETHANGRCDRAAH